MLEAEILDQLNRYGAWVERHEGIELLPKAVEFADGHPPVITVQLEVLERKRPSLLLAAAVVAIVGLVGVGWAASRSGSDSNAFLAADPPGALFVLPEENSGFSLTNASVETFTPTELFAEMVVFGDSDQGILRDLSAASLTRDKPQVAIDDWVDVETAAGVAEQSSAHFGTLVTRRSGDWWVTVTTGADRLSEAVRVLDGVTATAQGSLAVDEELSGQVIERINVVPESELSATYAEIPSGTVELEALVVG